MMTLAAVISSCRISKPLDAWVARKVGRKPDTTFCISRNDYDFILLAKNKGGNVVHYDLVKLPKNKLTDRQMMQSLQRFAQNQQQKQKQIDSTNQLNPRKRP